MVFWDKLTKLTKIHPTDDEINLVKINNRIQMESISKLFTEILELESELALRELQLQETIDLIKRRTREL